MRNPMRVIRLLDQAKSFNTDSAVGRMNPSRIEAWLDANRYAVLAVHREKIWPGITLVADRWYAVGRHCIAKLAHPELPLISHNAAEADF